MLTCDFLKIRSPFVCTSVFWVWRNLKQISQMSIFLKKKIQTGESINLHMLEKCIKFQLFFLNVQKNLPYLSQREHAIHKKLFNRWFETTMKQFKTKKLWPYRLHGKMSIQINRSVHISKQKKWYFLRDNPFYHIRYSPSVPHVMFIIFSQLLNRL